MERDKQYILNTVQPIYNLNDVASKEQIDQFNTDLNEKWQSSQLDSTETGNLNDYREVGTALLNYIYERGVLSLNNRYQNKGNDSSRNDPTSLEYNFVLIHDNIAQQKNTVDCYTIESANQYIVGALEKNKLIEHKKWLSEVLKNYITINYVFNESQTNKV